MSRRFTAEKVRAPQLLDPPHVAEPYIERIALDQKDRHSGVDAFRRGEKDVLVATDVASKGLDFENIQHVINFDMPEDIENYGMYE